MLQMANDSKIIIPKIPHTSFQYKSGVYEYTELLQVSVKVWFPRPQNSKLYNHWQIQPGGGGGGGGVAIPFPPPPHGLLRGKQKKHQTCTLSGVGKWQPLFNSGEKRNSGLLGYLPLTKRTWGWPRLQAPTDVIGSWLDWVYSTT